VPFEHGLEVRQLAAAVDVVDAGTDCSVDHLETAGGEGSDGVDHHVEVCEEGGHRRAIGHVDGGDLAVLLKNLDESGIACAQPMTNTPARELRGDEPTGVAGGAKYSDQSISDR
jgi:hypothetical protein